MNGPDHYREAENLLACVDETAQSTLQMNLCIQQAQVHATLAVAAATAYPAEKDYCGDEADCRSWVQVTS